MNCEKCGTKNELESIYCIECGNKLTFMAKEPKKKMNHRTKIGIGLLIGIMVVISGMMFFILHEVSPKRIAGQYMKAMIQKDVDTLYRYLEIGEDETFVTKEIYQQLVKENPNYDIENYDIFDIDYGASTVKVLFRYHEKNSVAEKILVVTLVRQKKNKWFFFPNWKISSSEMDNQLVENFKISVPKDANVTYAGIKVADAYLDKELSTNTTDVYVLKHVFSYPTKIEVKLKNGYLIEDEIRPSFYKNSYTAKVSLNIIDEQEQEKITSLMKTDLTALYNGAIQSKKLTEIENLSFNQEQKEELEKDYHKLVTDLKALSPDLIAIEFINITLSNVSLDENGNLEFRLKANYQYTTRYMDSSKQEQTKEWKGYHYMKLSYTIKNQIYYIVDANDLKNYFSTN